MHVKKPCRMIVSVSGVIALTVLFAGGEALGLQTPYLASLTGDRVRVRTGGSSNHFPFSTLRRGDPVVVVDEADGWANIQLPKWMPVFVHKDYVNLAADSWSGTVTANRLIVRVVPEKKHEPLGFLSRGDRLEVLKVHGKWLQIAPRTGLRAWVSARYLRPVRTLRAAEVATVWAGLAPVRQVVSGMARGTDPGTAGPRTSVWRSRSDGGRAGREAGSVSVSPRIAMAWQRAKILLSSNPSRSSFDSARRGFESIQNESEDLSEIDQARKGIEYVRKMEERNRDVRDAHELVEQAELEDQRLRKELVKYRRSGFRIEGADDDGIDAYLTRGWVQGNGRFIGRQGTHRLMKGNKVLYFLKGQIGIDLDTLLGRRVSIRGLVKELDPRFGADLILVSNVTLLSDR